MKKLKNASFVSRDILCDFINHRSINQEDILDIIMDNKVDHYYLFYYENDYDDDEIRHLGENR